MLRKRRPFTSADVDPALDSGGERVERADRIVGIEAEVEREVVARARRNADEREVVLDGGRGDHAERPVAAGSAEHIRAARDCVRDEPGQVVLRAQDDHVQAVLAGPLGETRARSLAVT